MNDIEKPRAASERVTEEEIASLRALEQDSRLRWRVTFWALAFSALVVGSYVLTSAGELAHQMGL